MSIGFTMALYLVDKRRQKTRPVTEEQVSNSPTLFQRLTVQSARHHGSMKEDEGESSSCPAGSRHDKQETDGVFMEASKQDRPAF